jgi:hypothetical protein
VGGRGGGEELHGRQYLLDYLALLDDTLDFFYYERADPH